MVPKPQIIGRSVTIKYMTLIFTCTQYLLSNDLNELSVILVKMAVRFGSFYNCSVILIHSKE